MKTELNNVVIECLDLEHGQEIKAFFIENGVDVDDCGFIMHKEDNDESRYYGVINGDFRNYTIKHAKDAGAEIIKLPKKENQQSEEVLVPDFRVGDTVYYLHPIIGLLTLSIISISEYNTYSITTEDSDGKKYTFTKNGQYTINGTLVLSHTPYNLINGGFSQRMKKVLPDIPVDTLVYVRRDRDKAMWLPMFFAEWKDGIMSCWDNQVKSNETNKTQEWKIWSLTNPLESK